ncbi:MAG: TonB-dependent receptor [Gammaproteobacteria bacterium]|nr:TonB-dependent receptor [Gammaproteobacteria bacterium]
MKKLILLAAVALASWPAQAAELETIVVHASRLGASTQQPTVLTDSEIEARRAYHAGDILRALPGMALSQAGNRGGLTQARVRGSEANHVLVMLDGIEMNNVALGGEYNFGHLDLTGARRVELMNGPQSAIWGSDALAGLVYIDTTPGDNAVTVDAGAGSMGTRDASITASRSGTAGHAAFTASHFATDGNNLARTGEEEDGYRATTLHGNLSRNHGPWTLAAVVRGVDAEVEYDPTPFPAYIPADGDNITESDRRYAKFEASHSGVGSWEPRLTITGARTRDENIEATRRTATVGGKTAFAFSNNFAVGDAHRLNATAELERLEFTQRGRATPFGDPNQRQATRTASVAAEYQFRTRYALASVSARFDANDEFDNSTAYHAGIAWALGPGRLFANVGTGTKNPTFTERFGYSPDTFIGNPELKPEQSVEYEVGYATQRLSFTCFDNRLTDEIDGFVYDPMRRGFTADNREQKSHRRGTEIGYADSFGRFRVSAHYTYVDSSEADRAEIRRPRHQGRVDLAGSITPSIQFNIGAAAVGEQYDNDFSAFPAIRRTLDSYVLAHGGLDVRLSARTRVYLQVENAFDTDYEDVFGYRTPGRRAVAGCTLRL